MCTGANAEADALGLTEPFKLSAFQDCLLCSPFLTAMLISFFLLAIDVAFAASLPRSENHDYVERKLLPGNWYQKRDHPVHSLFKRGPQDDGIQYAEVGSPSTEYFPYLCIPVLIVR